MKASKLFHERRDKMDCNSFELNISAYLDNELTPEEKQDFEEHAKECKDCKIKYENFKIMIESLNEIEEIPLPKDFHIELGKKLRQEASTKRKNTSFSWKYIGGIAAALLVVVVSTSFLNNNKNFYNKSTQSELAAPQEMAVEGDYGVRNQEMTQAFDAGSGRMAGVPEESFQGVPEENYLFTTNDTVETRMVQMKTSRKIIQRGQLTIEVENFDDVHKNVLDLVESSNGYIQHNEVYYYIQNREKPEESLKNANMELRIPSNDFSRIFEEIKALGVTVEENTSGEDITENYMDLDNQVENLKIQEERLREILKKADKVEDLLKIENELNRIRTQINYLTTTLKEYDNLVSMATINLHIRQVKNANLSLTSINDDLWNRAKNNFIHSINGIVDLLENGFVGFFGLLPLLMVLAVIGGPLGYFGYKKWKRKR